MPRARSTSASTGCARRARCLPARVAPQGVAGQAALRGNRAASRLQTACVTSAVVALAAQVAGVQRRIGGDLLDGLHDTLRGLELAQVLQQHHDRPEGADRVGQALAHDVEGRAVDRLEHRRIAVLGIDVAGRRDAQAAGQRRGQIAQDVGVQVGRDEGVERRRAVDHAGRGGVHEFLVPGDVRKLPGDLQRDLVPHHHRMALRVALGDHGQQLAGARLRQLEREAHDALDADAGHHRHVGRGLDRVALVDAAADAGVLAFGVLAHDDPVQVLGLAALQRAVDAGQDARRAHIGVLVEALADLQAQAPQRDVIGNVRVAGRAEQDRVLVAQRVQAVLRHHDAVLAEVVAAPVEVLELEAEGAARPASASSTCWPAGTTSLPMPSPGIVAMR